MKSPPWVHQLALQDSSWKWRLLPWLCVQTCTLWPTRVSLALEEPNSYVISLMELKSTFVLTSFIFWEGLQDDQLQGNVYLVATPSWRLWLSSASILQFPSILFKAARFTPLLKGQRKVPPSLWKVDLRLPPASPIGKSSTASSVSKLPETLPPHTLEPQPSSTHSQPRSSIPHMDRMMTLMEGLHECISGLANVVYSHNNHV